MQPMPLPFPVPRSRMIWDDLIKRYGELALLRQPGLADRWVVSVLGTFMAIERLGAVSNPADLKALLSTISPDTGVELTPDPSEKDVLVTLQFANGTPVTDASGEPVENRLLKIVAPPARIGTTSKPLYWRLQVRQ